MLEQQTQVNDKPRLPFYINKNFALLWSGQAVSAIGDWVFDTTLVLWIASKLAAGESWSPLAVSGVFLAVSLPVILVGTIAGVFVDRWKKYQTMLWMDAVRALLIFLMLPLTGLIGPSISASPVFKLAVIYTIVFLASACSQFFQASRPALLVDVVPQEYRAQATSSFQITFNFAIIVGPMLASLFVFRLGVTWAIVLNALSFVISFGLLFVMRVPPEITPIKIGSEKKVLQDWREGYRFFTSNTVLKTILITIVLIVAGLGAAQNLNVFFVTRNLNAPADFYGYLSGALGVGLLLGALITTRLAKRVGSSRIFWVSVLGMGLFQIIYAQQHDYHWGLLFFFLLGIPNGSLNAAVGPLMLEATPRNLLGRVSSIIGPVMTLTTMLSNLLSGYLYSLIGSDFHYSVLGLEIGPLDTIFTLVGLFIISGGLYARQSLTGYYKRQSHKSR